MIDENNTHELIDGLVDDLVIKKEEKKQSKLKEWFNDLWDDMMYWKTHYITSPLRGFTKGVSNLWRWRKIVWEDRWWDY
jgi:hypothetical protein